MKRPRIVIIGAGIAGASLAFELTAGADVVVLEMEPMPGQHATGRSAALFSETYGGPLVRKLSRASRSFLLEPPAGFAPHPLLSQRGVMYIASPEQQVAFAQMCGLADVARRVREIPIDEALTRIPILRRDRVERVLLEADAMDIDVHGLHQGYLRAVRATGGRIVCQAGISAIERTESGWRVVTPTRDYVADVIVNAAGAWGDDVAGLAGVGGIGLSPRRRTALIIDPPAGVMPDSWPMVIDVEESLYFKPEAGKLLLSPADETPSAACDALPDDYDVAVAVDRFESMTTANVRRVHRAWAGLRTFVSDREPVAGFSEDAPDFFWLVGQGGYGIQTAPALARLAASVLLERPELADPIELGIDRHALQPARLRCAGRVPIDDDRNGGGRVVARAYHSDDGSTASKLR